MNTAAAGAALAAGRAARDACYPHADKAAALSVSHPGPERDEAEAAIRAHWDHVIATQTPAAEPPEAAGHPVSA